MKKWAMVMQSDPFPPFITKAKSPRKIEEELSDNMIIGFFQL
jgi:hypothetical protein